jgi:hypothetical protein
LLWQNCGLCVDKSASEDIPWAKTERIKHSFANVNFGEQDANPVVKVLLEVLNVDGCLEVVPVANNDLIANNANNNAEKDENDGNRQDDNEQEAQQQQQQRQLLPQQQQIKATDRGRCWLLPPTCATRKSTAI